MRILIAGGTVVSRRALITLLGTRPDLEIVDDIAHVSQIELSLMETELDLLLFNGLPRDDSEMDLIQTVGETAPQTAVLVLCARPGQKEKMMAAGADAFVLKGDPPRKLLTAIETIRLRRENV